MAKQRDMLNSVSSVTVKPMTRISTSELRKMFAGRKIEWRGLRILSDSISVRDRTTRRGATTNPQAILTDALRAALGEGVVQSEVTGLVPGRKYRADIVIPSARLVIEFDGFQYHRSKTAFQKDRERQNLLMENGWAVLRFFNKQVRTDLDAVVQQIIRAVTLRLNLPPG